MLTETYSDKETLEFGKKLGENAVPGMIICLDGDLGTGKTVIAKGIALGLGITEPVSSPTFTVVKEYHEGRLPLYHFDVYRIEDPAEMEEIGYEEYFFGNGVTVVHFDFAGTPGEMEFCVNFQMDRWDEVTELYFERASVRILTPPPLNRQVSAVVEIYSENGALHQNLVLEDNRQWAFQLETDTFIKKVKEGGLSSDLEDAATDVEVIEKIYQTIIEGAQA